MVLSVIFSSAIFILSVYFLRGFVEDQIGIDGKTAKLLVMLLASLLGYGASAFIKMILY